MWRKGMPAATAAPFVTRAGVPSIQDGAYASMPSAGCCVYLKTVMPGQSHHRDKMLNQRIAGLPGWVQGRRSRRRRISVVGGSTWVPPDSAAAVHSID